MFLIFLLTVLLGVAVTHVGYSHDVVTAYLRRTGARSDAISMTNMSWRRLSAELMTGARPRASAVSEDQQLTSQASLLIFSSAGSHGSRAEVYDLDYDPANLAEPLADPRFFPASCPLAYMIRATVLKNEMAPFVMESVYEIVLTAAGGILESKPMYRREIFRQ